MKDHKSFVMAEVKAVEGNSANGEFEVVLSAPTLDRDGEVIDVKAFDPLPESIPFHAFHNFTDPIGRAVPRYEGDVLKARGYYASTPRAQEVRALVTEGVIGHTSVGFMPPTREVKDGTPHITKAEILEGSFVSVPSNREAAVITAKSYEAASRPNPTRKAIVGSYEERRDALQEAVRATHLDAMWAWVVATFDDHLVYEVEIPAGSTQYQADYSIADDGTVTLGAAVEVEVTEVVTPKSPSTDPEKAAVEAGATKAPADTPAEPPADVNLDEYRRLAILARAKVLPKN